MMSVRVVATVGTLSFFISGSAGAQNVEGGKEVFNQCMACHALDTTVFGPPLRGVVGRKAGSVQGYDYSPLLKAAGEAGLTWSDAEIARYVENPSSFLQTYLKSKGKEPSGDAKMMFMLSDEKQRKDVAAYLATVK